jgi:hypothetical protein
MMDADENLDMDVNWDNTTVTAPSSADRELNGSDPEPNPAEWAGVQIGMAEPEEDRENQYEEIDSNAGQVIWITPSAFHLQRMLQETLYHGNIHYPFSSEKEWKMAQWLHQSGVSLAKIDKFLRLSYVCFFHACQFQSANS